MKLTIHLIASLTAAIGCGAQAASPADSELIQRGEYLARAGDCVACHSLVGGETFAGGLKLPTPIGDIVATNISPSKTAGIGNYSLEQFSAAVRQGVRADGQRLYPAMPYTSYAKVTDADIAALYAYFMHGVKPVDSQPPETALPFPFNVRVSMALWNVLFLDDRVYQPDPAQSEAWNRGAYLVQGLTHCSTCHTPRNLLMAEDAARDLAGGEVGVWHAPNITADSYSGIGGWSGEELVQYLKRGNIAKGQASGPMAEAIDHSLQYLSDADLQAIAVYLKTVPAVAGQGVAKPVQAWGEAGDQLDSIRGVAWPQNPDELSGPQLFDAYCAACHQAHGQGSPFDARLPALFQNTATGRTQTNNLVMVILEGIHRVGEGEEIPMPGFAHELSDQQIATLGNYLTQSYGNPAAEVSVAQVKDLRAGKVAASVDLVLLARLGLALGVIVVLAALAWVSRRKRRAA
ncbi:cytochrome c [Pseudomonas sp. R5(2019)]|uniref:c-type cytochrome n=1 Tax=Pseudomonas sp. R5(2019) TaxID=2697566 RepID=UPI0014127A48|nr:cytochrome c [Pseudomonas sp. R5(2019)]NBA93368.1 c-type cytochrome [Pseudomonas sp. R5(2019)]